MIHHIESMATMRDAFTIRRLIIAVISSVLIFQNSPVDSFPLPDAPFESSSTFKTFPYGVFTSMLVDFLKSEFCGVPAKCLLKIYLNNIIQKSIIPNKLENGSFFNRVLTKFNKIYHIDCSYL